MPDNRDTEYDSENPQLDAEDWEIALKPYAGYPDAALDLARNFIAIQQCLERTPPDVPGAVAALNEAADSLFPLTRFHKGAYDLYRIFIEGRATRAHEALMVTGVNMISRCKRSNCRPSDGKLRRNFLTTASNKTMLRRSQCLGHAR